MDLELQGKVAIVTGASKGIGRGIALCLARQRMQVAIAARSAERSCRRASRDDCSIW